MAGCGNYLRHYCNHAKDIRLIRKPPQVDLGLLCVLVFELLYSAGRVNEQFLASEEGM
jgi:hypothetical protein